MWLTDPSGGRAAGSYDVLLKKVAPGGIGNAGPRQRCKLWIRHHRFCQQILVVPALHHVVAPEYMIAQS